MSLSPIEPGVLHDDAHNDERTVINDLLLSRSSKAAADRSRALRDTGYLAWNAQLSSFTLSVLPRLAIFGHSVVANDGFAQRIKEDFAGLAPNVVVTIQGNGGYTSAQIRMSASVNPVLAPATPHGAVVFMGMINDYFTNVPSATSKTNVLGFIADLKAANGPMPPSFLLVGEWEVVKANPLEPWSNYLKVLQEIADADPDVNFLDLSKRIESAAVDRYSLINPDNVHPGQLGSLLIRRLILSELLTSSPIRTVWPVHAYIDASTPPARSVNWGPTAGAAGASGPGLEVDATTGSCKRTSSGSQVSEISYDLPLSAGRYVMNLLHERGPDAGQYYVWLDGVQLGGVKWDGYNATVDNVASETVNYLVPMSGLHRVTIKMLTKNASSSNFVGRIRRLSISRYAGS